MLDTDIERRIDTARDNQVRAESAQKEYQSALNMLMPASPNWRPPVLTCSSMESKGIDRIWETILDHRDKLTNSGELAEKRKTQDLDWWSSTSIPTRRDCNMRHPAAVPKCRGCGRGDVLSA